MPQIFVKVDRDKVLKQGVDLARFTGRCKRFMGGYFINYFNRFGRQWQVYLRGGGRLPGSGRRTSGLFYVRNSRGESVPLSAFTEVEDRSSGRNS